MSRFCHFLCSAKWMSLRILIKPFEPLMVYPFYCMALYHSQMRRNVKKLIGLGCYLFYRHCLVFESIKQWCVKVAKYLVQVKSCTQKTLFIPSDYFQKFRDNCYAFRIKMVYSANYRLNFKSSSSNQYLRQE